MLETVIYLYFLLVKQAEPNVLGASSVTLASRSFSMDDRYGNKFVNDVFKDNILLTISYMAGSVRSKADISWAQVEAPFHYEFTLKPGEVFAFHEGVLPQYKNKVAVTTGVLFNSIEGFKYDGDLVGDGVCHLASLIYWAAKDAGLDAYAPSNHNFAKINDVPKEYGVGILAPSPLGNLYITNNKEVPVTFAFDFDGTNLTISVLTTKV